MEKYFEILKKDGADLAIEIDPKTIVTAPWVGYICRFSCKFYNSMHRCPPNTPTWKETQEIINCYKRAILFRNHMLLPVTPMAVKAQKEMFLDGYYKSIAFGAGAVLSVSNATRNAAIFKVKRCRLWRHAE